MSPTADPERSDDGMFAAPGTTDRGDRPTEEIGFNFTEPRDPTSVQDAPEASGAGLPSGDDRPTEGIGFNFTKPQEPKPSAEAASGLSFKMVADDLIDFSGLPVDEPSPPDEQLMFSAGPNGQVEDGGLPSGSGLTENYGMEAQGDRTDDGIADLVPAPPSCADDFIA